MKDTLGLVGSVMSKSFGKNTNLEFFLKFWGSGTKFPYLGILGKNTKI